ncbi:MAG: hypothetical protein V2B18_24385 [Pseudomonadota bacterium]
MIHEKNEKGSAILIVMFVVAAVGLVGAGLLIRGSVDTQVSSAIGAMNWSFTLAEGSVEVSEAGISQADPDRKNTPYSGEMVHKVLIRGSEAYGNYKSTDSSSEKQKWFKDTWFVADVSLRGFGENRTPGYDVGSFYDQYWVCEGRITMAKEEDSTKESQRSKEIVDRAMVNVKPRHYGGY